MTAALSVLGRALGVVVALSFAVQAEAHAHLQSAVPSVDAAAASFPAELKLRFSEGLELHFSGATLTGPGAGSVPVGNARLGTGDSELIVPILGALGPGRYAVNWHALSHDGHSTRGSYAFTVLP
ncbi:MAG: Cu resistance protein [Variovorax sp.]|nr:MAG: Cu resistance protein [Variovorax sp.]